MNEFAQTQARQLPVEAIAEWLSRPGGATLTELVASLGERRDIVTLALERMRDELGYPVRWNPDTGAYVLDNAPVPAGNGPNFALLYRAIALQERLYVTVAGASSDDRLHGLPGRITGRGERRGFPLRAADGSEREVALASIIEIREALGTNK